MSRSLCGVVIALSLVAAFPTWSHAQAGNGAAWDEVGRILQTPAVFGGGYYRFNLPRRDLTLRLGDVTVAPELALGAWAGFSGDPAEATMMGDLVLTAGELRTVLAELARQHIEVTAIHNHLVGEQPRLIYVHVHGHGSATGLASRLDHAIALTGTPRPVAAAVPTPLTIDTTAVFAALGRSGRARGAVAQLTFILVPGTVSMDSMTVTPALGYASPVNVQLVGPDRIVATGDFSVIGAKVDPLLQALAAHGIVATAVHSHMVDESPRIYFIHFWADGPQKETLAGLRAAIDAGR